MKKLSILTKQRFNTLSKSQGYYRKRWQYMSIAAGIIRDLKPESVLEIGPGRRGKPVMVKGADTLDVSGRPTFRHDAGVISWPVKQRYDLIVALQVWEHLKGQQRHAFQEAMRRGRYALLSFPYEWEQADEIHEGITMDVIRHWTCRHRPQQSVLVMIPEKRKRLICLYRSST